MARLTDICTPKQWKTISTSELTSSGYPVYGANGVIGYYSTYNHEKPTILITCRGATCGRINICDEYSYVTGNAMALDDLANEIDIRYLFYFLEHRGFDDVITGSAQPQIVRESLKNVNVVYPIIPVQRRIAATLDKVSEGIALCKQMLVDLDELVKSQFVEIFGDPVKNERAWAMKPIKDLYSVGSSKRIYAAEQTTVGVPFLRVSDICSLIDGDNVQPSLYISEDKFAELESNDLVPTANDILVTSRGTIGRCYIIKASDKFYFQDGMVTWLKQKGFDIEPIYVSMLFAANSFSELLDKATNKTTVHYISIDKLAAIPIPVPPIELQKQFTAFVEQAYKSKFAVQQQLMELETLKESLMQEYFG